MATAKKAAKSTKAPAPIAAVKKPRAAKKVKRALPAPKKAAIAPKVQRSIDKLTKDITAHVAKKSVIESKIKAMRTQLKELKNPAA